MRHYRRLFRLFSDDISHFYLKHFASLLAEAQSFRADYYFRLFLSPASLFSIA